MENVFVPELNYVRRSGLHNDALDAELVKQVSSVSILTTIRQEMESQLLAGQPSLTQPPNKGCPQDVVTLGSTSVTTIGQWHSLFTKVLHKLSG